MPMTAIASARGVVEAGENDLFVKCMACYIFFTALLFLKQCILFFLNYTYLGHDLGHAHAQDLDPEDTATDLAHAAVATAGTYT